MDLNAVHSTLLDNCKVASIVCHGKNTYMQIAYECFISCEIATAEQMIPIFIGIPEGWEQELIDIYIEDYKNFPFIPHVDTNGKLCLFDLEGALIDINLYGLLNQCIGRAILIISDGLSGRKKEDFIKEYSLYWKQLPRKRTIKCAVPKTPITQTISYASKAVSRHKNETYAAYQKRLSEAELFASVYADDFRIWNINESQQNGIYFYLHSESYIFPPDARLALNFEFINNLLKLIVSKEYSRAMRKVGNDKLFVFDIEQPNNINTCFGVLIKNATIVNVGEFYQLEAITSDSIYPLYIQRVDKSYLMNRTHNDVLKLEKKCLLIGCGSIGGYLVNELIKSGFENITLVDSDVLMAENVFRHILGIEYVGQYKTNALVHYFEKNIPHLSLTPVDDNIRSLVEEGSIDLSEYDFIISATGNHNINRWLNKIIYEQNIIPPVFYVWNEPLDIGCHVAVIQSTLMGCYECFFKRSEKNQQLYDSTAYCASGQNITKNVAGCGGSYIPYGSTISLKSSALCMDWIIRVIEGRCCDNVLVSLKGEGYYFKKAGYEVSDVYTQQLNDLEIIVGAQFKNVKCKVCG